MEILDQLIQNSDSWFKARLGSLGGSQITTAVSKGSGRQKLLYKKAAEILSQTNEDGYSSKYLDRGHEFEAEARMYYAMVYQVEPIVIGMVRYDEYKHYSADFLIGEDGFGEIKIRIPSVYLEYSDNGTLGTGDRRQVQWGFRVTGRKYCDHITYCPEMAQSGAMEPMIVKRMYPDDKEIKSLDMGANKFIGELINYVNKKKGE